MRGAECLPYTEEGGAIFECIIIDAHPTPGRWGRLRHCIPYSLNPKVSKIRGVWGFDRASARGRKSLYLRLEIIYSPSPIRAHTFALFALPPDGCVNFKQ